MRFIPRLSLSSRSYTSPHETEGVMTMRNKRYIIYWEKSIAECGFVSYDNPTGGVCQEYTPVSLRHASVYTDLKCAEHTRDWYVSRGGFGYFYIMEWV